LPSALQAAVECHADPELLVRFVKQAMNKPYNDLQTELELRPNNNDLSVMSIIQSRKCTLTQTKPGLVVIHLEEMPEYFPMDDYCDDGDKSMPKHDPNQLQVCQLVAQRFGGRKGEYDTTKKAPRNSEKLGIGNDASLITMFTSNYALEAPSREALQRLPMLKHLAVVEVKAISDSDRSNFAIAYFRQAIHDRIRLQLSTVQLKINLNVPLGEGDTRPLVRHLRMLAYYVSAIILADGGNAKGTAYDVQVAQNDKSCQVVVGDRPSLDLYVGTLDNLFPVKHPGFDPRTEQVIKELQTRNSALSDTSLAELSTILDFWLGCAFAPAVILSQQGKIVESLIAAIQAALGEEDGGVQCLTNIEAGSYKMMKSLYDPHDTPNLRDDILKVGGGRRSQGTLVATEIRCASTDAQLCIREMLEDTPSMTAFSSDKSALNKSGLLFAVHIQGDEITPQLQSRASLIL
jgi:hypothetical protein